MENSGRPIRVNAEILSNGLRSEDVDAEVVAAIYARTSSPTPGFGYSLEGQVRESLQRCERMDWTPAYVFQDEAESGKDDDRPKFKQMMSVAERGHIDVVVFWKLDRFSRSLLHAVQLEAKLREFDVALHSVTEQIDTTTPAGRFNFRNIASAAEFERDHIRQRSRMGLRELATQGKWPNDSPPLGYAKREDAMLEVDRNEAELVIRIFDRYLELRSMPKLAHELNGEGILTKRGKRWTARAISDVISNKLYIGEYSVAGIEKELEENRIVDDELFDEVTEVRTRFQRDVDSECPPMERDRKSISLDRVISQYLDYLEYDVSAN